MFELGPHPTERAADFLKGRGVDFCTQKNRASPRSVCFRFSPLSRSLSHFQFQTDQTDQSTLNTTQHFRSLPSFYNVTASTIHIPVVSRLKLLKRRWRNRISMIKWRSERAFLEGRRTAREPRPPPPRLSPRIILGRGDVTISSFHATDRQKGHARHMTDGRTTREAPHARSLSIDT